MKGTKWYIATFIFFIIIQVSFAQNINSDSLAKRHQEMMDILFTKPKVNIKTIGILLYDGYNTLDAMGPYHVLSELMGVQIFFIGKEKGLVRNQFGMQVQVDYALKDIKALDVLVIPGGAKETFMLTQDTAVLNWIRQMDQTTTYTTSVCTGAWVLGATGLLKGKNVTTNWYRAEEMMKRYGANFKQERWVRDGKYWTSAGVTAGLDMALAIIDELMGEKYTKGVMLDLEYDPNPPYKAGSVKNTETIVIDMMREMYDLSLLPLLESSKKQE
ncbi:MAG: DJ-1/PfpI family protein [Saprospiraceae bacterium]